MSAKQKNTGDNRENAGGKPKNMAEETGGKQKSTSSQEGAL
ncbi:hypothetical protein [Fictibacillus barbaricus]|uniref:YuzL-like protein n=1 Tax=Fictibacillus barbaricus TaxID=182136 RepID=A0ABU1U192_9BACL|nr:hypothetical protein [Fictibacillus barbaricus]MDR7073247.1 hypothetical protein [Fictibacillus barbaricus]